MYTVRSVGNGRWTLEGGQTGETLSGLTIRFMQGKAERNGSSTYYCTGPAFASIKITASNGTIVEVNDVPVAFD